MSKTRNIFNYISASKERSFSYANQRAKVVGSPRVAQNRFFFRNQSHDISCVCKSDLIVVDDSLANIVWRTSACSVRITGGKRILRFPSLAVRSNQRREKHCIPSGQKFEKLKMSMSEGSRNLENFGDLEI